jgi:hypothetical protein
MELDAVDLATLFRATNGQSSQLESRCDPFVDGIDSRISQRKHVLFSGPPELIVSPEEARNFNIRVRNRFDAQLFLRDELLVSTDAMTTASSTTTVVPWAKAFMSPIWDA